VDASAFGAHHMQKKHQLAQGQTLKFEPVAADGSVSVTFRADRPFDINGEYDVTLTFTSAEIDQFYRNSIAGTISGLANKNSNSLTDTLPPEER
jgi:hypothetical protein